MASPIKMFLKTRSGIAVYQELIGENNMALKKQAEIMNIPRPSASCR
jgi:hypothetical protein